MDIKRVVTGALAENCYVIINGDSAIVIDPGDNINKILEAAEDKHIEVVLLTHGHFDHAGAAKEFQERGVPVYVQEGDASMLYTQKLLAMSFGQRMKDLRADILLKGDETLELAGLSVQVLHTPGHSLGSVVYIICRNIFSGDTLFRGTYGRCDLRGGDFYSIRTSIKDKLFRLSGDYDIYPGHDEMTTLAYEREHNDILYD